MKIKNKGMTLIEVIISVALLAIVLIPIANVGISTIQTNKKADTKQKGSEVGQKVLEQVNMYDDMTVVGDVITLSNGLTLKKSALDGEYKTENPYEESSTGTKFKVDVLMKKNVAQEESKWYNIGNQLNDYCNVIYVGQIDPATATFGFSWVLPGENHGKTFLTTQCSVGGDAQFTTGNAGKYTLCFDQNMKITIKSGIKGPTDDVSPATEILGMPVIEPVIISGTSASQAVISEADPSTKKVLFVLGSDFSNAINVDVESKLNSNLEIDVLKESDATTGTYNFNVTNINAATTKNVLVRSIRQLTNHIESVGDLYDISVVVKDDTGEEIFTGNISKNILITK